MLRPPALLGRRRIQVFGQLPDDDDDDDNDNIYGGDGDVVDLKSHFTSDIIKGATYARECDDHDTESPERWAHDDKENVEIEHGSRELEQYQQLYRQRTQPWARPRKLGGGFGSGVSAGVKPEDRQSFIIKGQSKSLQHQHQLDILQGARQATKSKRFIGLASSHRGQQQQPAPQSSSSLSSLLPSPRSTPSSSAAGTPTRTLRQKVAALQKEKQELVLQATQQQSDNDELKERIDALEAALREMPRLSVSAPSGDCVSASASTHKALHDLSSGQAHNLETHDDEHVISRAVYEHDVTALREEVEQVKSALEEVAGEKEAMEQQLTASEMARRFVTWRYCFRCLDTENTGFIGFESLIRFQTFETLSIFTLRRAYSLWCELYAHERKDRDGLDEDETVKFVAWAEEKGSISEATRFWFQVVDIDGDGYIGKHDILEHFESLRGHVAAYITEADLFCQICDMVRPKNPARGFTLAELRESGLVSGVLNMIVNHKDATRNRTTAEWSSRGSHPL